jgi:site-specific DNA-methyltransferase (adenine-specific)
MASYMDELASASNLSPVERFRLSELEAVVERGLATFRATFRDVGLALSEIRAAGLYRATHPTFEDYCDERWGFGGRRGRQLIAAAELGTIVPVANEGQARELVPLLRNEGEEAVLKVWREAIQKYGADHVTGLNLKAIIGNRVRRRIREQEIRVAAAHGGPLAGDNYWLLHGDLLEVELPAQVDVIITDPPYPTDFLDCYAKLSKLGARVLPEGGSVLAMAMQHKLLDVHERLSLHLDYVWELAWLYANGAKQRYWKGQVFNTWKPVLWYANGKPRVQSSHGTWVRDSILNIGNPAEDKAHHHWGQSVSGVKELVEQFSKPGDTILDPFVGGGSTAAAAIELGRRFIGIDIDEQAIRTTAARIVELELAA